MAKTPLNQLLDFVSMIDDGTIPFQIYSRIENLMEAEHQMVVESFNDGCSNPGDGYEYFEMKFGKFEKTKPND
jgi:hypothetical protein